MGRAAYTAVPRKNEKIKKVRNQMNELYKVIESLFFNGYSKRTVIRMVRDIWKDLMWRARNEK